MTATKLKKDLENCLITFDRRVLLTELLDDYDLPYEEINKVVTNHLKEQENKGELKYEKRYVVHGVEEGDHKKEVYKVVAETKLKEWLKKLNNAESSLYSVEVVGGTKAPANIFKPMKVNENVKLKDSSGPTATTSNGCSVQAVKAIEKKPIKVETSKPFQETYTDKHIVKSPAKAETATKIISPKTESPPTDKKPSAKKEVIKKGGINNFFAPATQKKVDAEAKSNKSVVKPPTPKKLQDYFKKQTEKPETPSKKGKNTSIQLFDSEDEEKQDPEEDSSDEEEKIEALKRDIISSDIEMDEGTEETDKPSTSNKRRRILDSDDDEDSRDPPIKQEKLDIKEDEDEKVEEPETYLDEEGFVITRKPKQKSNSKASPTMKTTPPVTLKSSAKEIKKASPTSSKDNKKSGISTTKTKQAGIMSFFSKK